MKKTIALLLITLMLLPMLTACSAPVGMVDINDPAVSVPHKRFLSEKILEKAAQNPEITSENHPRWTGFSIGYFDRLGETGSRPKLIKLVSEWGFNSARICLDYDELFSRDMTEANMNAFYLLDSIVAAAIEHDIHLNIIFFSIPGRNVIEAAPENDYISTPDLDLFVNEEKQAMADKIFEIIARRYKDVPNYNLSITPIWEPANKDRSTGLPYPEYTWDDAAAYLGRAIDVIRAEDPDRLIIYEPSGSNDKEALENEAVPAKAIADQKGNVIISYNFVQMAYVYACMTHVKGRHIDNMNSSMFIPEYPNYIYMVPEHICHGQDEDDLAITLEGLLPEGTVITLQIKSSIGGTLDISADGESLYSEELEEAEYEISEPLSSYYPYRVSEKSVSAVLPRDAENVVLSCKKGAYDICGITLDMPEEYAVEKWYFAQAWDVYEGRETKEGVIKKSTSQVMICPNDFDRGQIITVNDDMTYTTRNPENTKHRTWVENDFYYDMADRGTIDAWSQMISEFDGNCVIRFERADFSGGIWPEMKEYYEDLLQSFEEYGYSWWSNDWWLMTEEYAITKVVAESPDESFAGYDHFNVELLELMQKYQSKER